MFNVVLKTGVLFKKSFCGLYILSNQSYRDQALITTQCMWLRVRSNSGTEFREISQSGIV